jgi:hypothetical protein
MFTRFPLSETFPAICISARIFKQVLGIINRLLFFRDTYRIENYASDSSSIAAYIACRKNVFTEPLPSNGKVIDIQMHRLMCGIC